MAQPYQLIAPPPGMEAQHFLRIADGAVIPADPANRDYQEYLEWVEAGNTADPAADPSPPLASQRPAGAAG